MKKFLIVCAIFGSFIAAQAQWSVGLDARLAPWGEVRKNAGTDIVVNYKFNMRYFFVMPSAGLFYQNFYYDGINWIPSPPAGCKEKGYRTGFDITAVIGKDFKVGPGSLGLFTGPRYCYAFAQQKVSPEGFEPNNLDWRIGASYSIWKITASAKVDFACLKLNKAFNDHPVPVLAIGLAYNF